MKGTSLLTRQVYTPNQIAVWYYMGLSHPWRADELFQINFEFKSKQPVTKMSSKLLFSKI